MDAIDAATESEWSHVMNVFKLFLISVSIVASLPEIIFDLDQA